MILGTTAFFGWLLIDGGGGRGKGGPFALLGIGALISGVTLLPIGLLACWFGARGGAPRKSVLKSVVLLFINLPLALTYFLGLGIARIQRVEVVNHASVPLEQLTLLACERMREEVGTLAPGAHHVWRFTPPSEGSLQFSCLQQGRRVEAAGVVMFFVFCRIDVLLEIREDGNWTVREEDGGTWSWLPGM